MKYLLGLAILMTTTLSAQVVPSEFENIEYLATFSQSCNPAWGDDDHVQTFFFIVPKSFTEPIYIRVFDPNVGGKNDMPNGAYDSKTKFSVYAGKGAHSHPDARGIDPKGKYKSGSLLSSKTFDGQSRYDDKWYTFGPFNPMEGEESEQLGGFVFKVIAEGLTGNDGNLYKYALSVSPDNNRDVEGSNAFTYEYSFRLPESPKIITHLYPFIDDRVLSFTQHNFDFDRGGGIYIYSIAKNRHKSSPSANYAWATSKHMIDKSESNTTLDVQIVKSKYSKNDMVIYLKNQYDEAIAFFSTPIGGPPKFKYKVDVKYHSKDDNEN